LLNATLVVEKIQSMPRFGGSFQGGPPKPQLADWSTPP
jgi:hypothetical protein